MNKFIEMYFEYKWRLWVNEFKSTVQDSADKILHETVSTTGIKELIRIQIAFELFIPRNNNYYAMVGFEYIPDNQKSDTDILVYMKNEKIRELYNNPLAYQSEKIYTGILEEYGQAVMDSAVKTLKKIGSYYPGKIVFNIGAYSDVGSSINMFKQTTNIGLRLMQIDLLNIPDQSIREIINSMIMFYKSNQSTKEIIKSILCSG